MLAVAVVCLLFGTADASTGLGRPATADEIAAWDIDVRPDFVGLPPGSGSVQTGGKLWDDKCASCHGSFGESNEVFTPIIGGTTKDDIGSGRVAALNNRSVQRTSMMKLSTLSTLWDYIRRAMPWTAPKSLTVDDVYGLVAYLLYLSDIVTDDFVLSNANIASVQARLPNRLGVTREHGLWEVGGRPDVQSRACMTKCPVSGTISSTLPDEASGSHGDLTEQFRLVGPARGTPTRPASVAPTSASPVATSIAQESEADATSVATKHGCTTCHAMSIRVVGPAFDEVRRRYADIPGAATVLSERIRSGGSGKWGAIAMPPQSQVNDADLDLLVGWILGH
jgi:cytochrome c